MMIAPRLALLISTIALMACGDDTPPECSPARRSSTMLDPEFVLLEPGSFVMGSTPGTYEYPTMDVTLTRPFWIQTSEVTSREFGRTSDAFQELLLELTDGSGRDVTTPGVEGTTWYLEQHKAASQYFPMYNVFSFAVGYANGRSAIEGYELCYDLSVCNLQEHLDGSLSDGYRILACSVVAANNVDPDCPGYRLPTEAEWEYAARAGAEGDRACEPWPECMEGLAAVRDNYAASGSERSGYSGAFPIASLRPNSWCLYDMHGNVPEWTGSFRSPYVSGEIEDTSFPAWWLDSDLTDPQGLGHPVDFCSDCPGYVTYSGPLPATIGDTEVRDIFSQNNFSVVRGNFMRQALDQIRTSDTSLYYSNQLAGFRVVRTAFEVMEERAQAGEGE